MLVKDLQLYPYRIHIKHELTETDKEKRVAMCQWFSKTIDNNEEFLNDVWFSDEAHFLLNGHANSFGEVRTLTESLDALCIKTNAQHGLPFPSMVSSDHLSLKMITVLQ